MKMARFEDWIPEMHLHRLVFSLGLLPIGALSQAQYPARSWDEAYSLASESLAILNVSDKVTVVSGIGIRSPCIGNTAGVVKDNLTIPSLCLSDGPAGLNWGIPTFINGTGFPAGINVASTFSRRLMRARGAALGQEARGVGVNIINAPAMDIMRNPKGGRIWESFGSDPYLQGESAYETVKGIQSTGVVATAKHFILNNQETFRTSYNVEVNDRTFHEVYSYPFVKAIEADVGAIMSSYNYVNGTSSGANPALIGEDGFAKKHGFKGFIVSDWNSVYENATTHANAGLDLEMPGGIGNESHVYGDHLLSAIEDGTVTEETLDKKVLRILAALYFLGQDQGFPEEPNLSAIVRTDETITLVREIAAASTVLLKNDLLPSTTAHALPLSLNYIQSLAIVGTDADYKNCSYSIPLQPPCLNGTLTIGYGSGSNHLEYTVPPIQAIREYVQDSATITASLDNELDTAKQAAEGRDAVIVFVEAWSGEDDDREDLLLRNNGNELIRATASVNSNTIVVIHSVGPIIMDWNDHENITAILYAGLPGEQTGPGLVDVLFGDVNPSGRLPFSIADDERDYGGPNIEIILSENPTYDYSGDLFLDYRYMQANDIKPRYEFGFGLSYTTFEYSALAIEKHEQSVTIKFTLENIGDVDGVEIPQLYLSYPENAGEPSMLLRGFDDVFLKAGESKEVSFSVDERGLSVWDTVSQSWVRPEGSFGAKVGASIGDIRLEGAF